MTILFDTMALSAPGKTDPWDLALDGSGNLFTLSGANALAQDVASAISTFYGEVYYSASVGVPYLSRVFGQSYSPSIAAHLIKKQAAAVPNVSSVKVVLNSFVNRQLSGTVNFIDVNAAANGVSF
jgi:hypothetical protein